MTKPKVQSLDAIMADLNAVYDPKRQHIAKQQAAIPERFDAQRSGMEAQKTNEFRNINTQANTMGRAFGGMPVAEQTRYLGEQFLPGMQQLDLQQNDQLMQLEGMLAELLGEQRGAARQVRQGQQSSLEQFLEAQRQRQHQAQLQREQLAAQERLQQMSQAHQSSLARQSQPSPRDHARADAAQMMSELASRNAIGGDSYVSPSTFKQLRARFVPIHGEAEFLRQFGGLVNPDHQRDYGVPLPIDVSRLGRG